MSSKSPVYVYEMQYSKRRELNQILDVNEGWKKLGKCSKSAVPIPTVESDETDDRSLL